MQHTLREQWLCSSAVDPPCCGSGNGCDLLEELTHSVSAGHKPQLCRCATCVAKALRTSVAAASKNLAELVGSKLASKAPVVARSETR